MLKKEFLSKLEKELYFLKEKDRKEQLEYYDEYFKLKVGKLNDESDVAKSLKSPSEVAREIYEKKGIEYDKLKKNIFSDIEVIAINYSDLFLKSNNKGKIIRDTLFILLVLLLLYFPFGFLRDLGFDYINILTKNSILELVWNVGFLIIYTIVFIIVAIGLLKSYIKNHSRS